MVMGSGDMRRFFPVAQINSRMSAIGPKQT
jgi:hypothetical protein